MPQIILTSVDSETHVATLTLNRPERLNAFDDEMVDAWAAALEQLAARGDVHVIVVTGAGKAFCAGGDLSTLASELPAVGRKEFLRDHVHRVARALRDIEQPVIAMVNGAAMGAGLDMALMCDMRIAAADAKLGEAYVNVGIVAGDGGAWLLPRLVGPARALELLLTGQVISGTQAADWGMVNRAVEADQLAAETYALATKLASGPQLAQRLIKRAVYAGQHMTLDAHYDMISSYMAIAQSHDDFAGAVSALIDKRKPEFNSGDPRP
ncbi:MAG: enoyl-CoA hydratase/isomerase family protein [Thermoleophilaceae bacterium]|nr:enoyl-CoA hydratase/isomerase family protein [Thermoleophilaceae bacterium]